MSRIARAALVIGLAGCSVAGREAVVVSEDRDAKPAPAWMPAAGGALASASGPIAYAWQRGRVVVTRRDVDPRATRDPRRPAPARASIALETIALGRESAIATFSANQAPAPTVRNDGALLVDRGGIAIERLEQRRAGLSQSWKLATKPSGKGDLVFRLRVDGAKSAHADASGLVLTTDGGAAPARSFRYGVATWIDASGSSFRIAPTIADGVIEIRVPATVVDAAAFPATLDPIVSAETYGPSPIATPRVAGSGASYVAVWQDWSSAVPRIVSARVDDATGKVLSPFDVPVSGAAPAEQPAIATAGTGYLVAYREASDPNGIRARWLDSTGAPIAGDFAISGTANSVYSPAVACGGARCLVAWHEFVSGVPQIRAAYVDRATSAVSDVVAVTSSSDSQYVPDVATDGTSFLVAWDNQNANGDSVAAALLGGASIQVVDVETTPTWYRSVPRVAYAVGQYVVAYSDIRNITSIDVFAKRLDANGALLDASALTVAGGDGDEDYPVIGSDGTHAVVAWTDGASIADAVLSSSGAVAASRTIAVVSSGTPEAIGASASHLFALWSGSGADSSQAFGARISSSDGATLDAVPIQVSAGPGSCSPVTIGASPTDVSSAGTAITLTAASTCTDATPEYQFWVETPGLGFQMLRDFSSDATAQWTTTQLPTDTYRVVARARRAGLFADWESEAELYHGIVGTNGVCSQVGVDGPTDPISAGTTVDVFGAATCTGGESPEYQFLLQLPNGISWVARDWATSATFAWDTTSFPWTNATIVARSRRVGSSAAFDAEATLDALVTDGPGFCPDATLTPSATVLAGGASVDLTAWAGCTNDETAEYEFVVRPPSGSTRVFRAYGASPTATFTADGVSGVHHFWVRTRRAGSALPLEGRAAATVYVQ